MSKFLEVRPENAAVAIPFEFIHPPLSDENVQALSLPSSVEGEKRKLVHGWELSPDGLCTKKGEHSLDVRVLTSPAEIDTVTSSPKKDFLEHVHRLTTENAFNYIAYKFLSVLGVAALSGTVAYAASSGNTDAAIGSFIGGGVAISVIASQYESYQDDRISWKQRQRTYDIEKFLEESSNYFSVGEQEVIGDVYIADYLAHKLSKDPSPADLWQSAALPFLLSVREAKSKIDEMRSDIVDLDQVSGFVGSELEEDSRNRTKLIDNIDSAQKFITNQISILDTICEKRLGYVEYEKSLKNILTTEIEMTIEGKKLFDYVLSTIRNGSITADGAVEDTKRLVSDTIMLSGSIETSTQADAVLAKLKEKYSSIMK